MSAITDQIRAAIKKATDDRGQIRVSRWILRLGKDDGKFEPWYERDFEKDFHAFLCCLETSRAHRAVEKRMSEARKLRTFLKKQNKPEKIKKAKKKEASSGD